MDTIVQELEDNLPDAFSRTLLKGGLEALNSENPIRAHLFATALRELIGHLLHLFAPDQEVSNCGWFRPEAEKPTRRQRATYAIQGGLPDATVSTLGIDPRWLHSEMRDAFAELNKRTHVRVDTVLSDAKEIEDFQRQVLTAVNEFLSTIHELRAELVSSIQSHANSVVFEKLIEETVAEIDLLSTHSLIEHVEVEELEVEEIRAREILYRASGSVIVELNYGSGSDRANDMGATMSEEYPFTCAIEGSVDDLENLLHANDVKVDTSSFYE